MTLLGCSAAGDQCQPVRTLDARYAAIAACDAAAEAVLIHEVESSFPVMAVHCRRVDAPAIAAGTGPRAG